MKITTTEVNYDFNIRYFHDPKKAPRTYKFVSCRQFISIVDEIDAKHGEVPEGLAKVLIEKTYTKNIDVVAHSLRRGIKFEFEWR